MFFRDHQPLLKKKRSVSFTARNKLKANMWVKLNTTYSIIMIFNIAPRQHSVKMSPKNWCLGQRGEKIVLNNRNYSSPNLECFLIFIAYHIIISWASSRYFFPLKSVITNKSYSPFLQPNCLQRALLCFILQ